MADDLSLMRTLYRIASAVNDSLDLDNTLQSVVRAVCETLEARGVAVRLLSPDAKALEVVASEGLSAAFLAALPAQVTPGSLHEQVLGGRILGFPDLQAACRADPNLVPIDGLTGLLRAEKIGGALAIPLSVRDRPIGSLNIFCKAGCYLGETERTVMEAVADLAALAIENARLHSALFKIAGALTSTLELRPLLQQVLAATVMEMGLKAASVRLLDRSGRRLELAAAYGLSEAYLAKGTIDTGRSPIDRRLLAGETVVLFDVAGEEGFQYPAEAAAEGIRSVLAVPLRVKAKVVGVMRAYSAQPRHFTSVGIAFLQSAAGLVAVAVENAKLYQALQTRYEDLKADVSEWYRFLSLG